VVTKITSHSGRGADPVRVRALQIGTVTVRPSQLRAEGSLAARQLRILRDRAWSEPLPILAWLIDHPEGPIVVDTGESARATRPGYWPRWHPFYRWSVRVDVTPEQEIGPQLARLGLAPADVRLVVLTHLHSDHAGGLAHFPRSEIVVHAA
jgi:N-acyl homoserine lactone hydrolase